ncbi:MAG: RnfABCDGE type electron transport complex subunit B [Oscillospiraceae bacterium]|nr:RnfABCDGE type electron transport complex subunit B [Oscillospiraceae bacterium]
MAIITPMLIVASIGIVAGVMLALAAKFMAITEDETFTGVRELLPGVNCGACGHSGCDGYARQIVDADAPLNLCPPGGNQTARAIGKLLGRDAGDVMETQAIVRCSRDCGRANDIMEYQGTMSCESNNYFYQGRRSCSHACLGFGDCVNACQYGALRIRDGIAVVDPWACSGCGMCVARCPNALIKMVPKASRVFVGCHSHDTGAFVRRLCPTGCIGCKRCEKECRFGAIIVDRYLASVDPEKCTNCGDCVAVCPTKCIRTAGNLSEGNMSEGNKIS